MPVGLAEEARNKGTTTQTERRQFRILILSQSVVTLVVSLIVWLSTEKVAGYSALLGGSIYLIPYIYQASRVLTSSAGSNIRQTVRDLYKSEIWKMALTLVLFGLVFTLVKPLEPFSLFGVFILMQLISWLAPLLLNHLLFKN
ncbi:MAG: ATP synthase protein I [Motiliproteus sp.]|jgi:ATP synthase protein I